MNIIFVSRYLFFCCLLIISISFFICSFFNLFPISLYGCIIALYFFIQITLCLLNRRAIQNLPQSSASVSLLVVGYREDEEYWANCINSIKNQEYPHITKVIISIDGNSEEDIYMKDIAEEILVESGINYDILLNVHGGKREAISYGLEHFIKNKINSKYILFLDSDTILSPTATKYLVDCVDSSDKNGCATGNLLVFDTHFLGRLLNARYAYAFNIERAALSYCGVMNCCSGPLSIYRSKIFDTNFIEEFKNQKFLGIKCGPGDDRHLTNMFLIKGFKSRQTHLAIGYTESPGTFIRFIKQQTRWMRSFFREQYWQILAIGNQSIFLSVVTQYEILFPVFVFSWLCSIVAKTSGLLLLRMTLITTGVMFLRTLILICLMKDFYYGYNILYLPMFMFCLLPLKVYCLFTMRRMQWITSSRIRIINKIDTELFIISLIMICWDASVLFSMYNKLYPFIIKLFKIIDSWHLE
jgi:hyaluronan synthase